MSTTIAGGGATAGLPAGRYIETLYDEGLWRTRWHQRDSTDTEPFAAGQSRERMVASGAEVARWNQVPHVIRNRDGDVVEINGYGAGPYPHRSPIRQWPL